MGFRCVLYLLVVIVPAMPVAAQLSGKMISGDHLSEVLRLSAMSQSGSTERSADDLDPEDLAYAPGEAPAERIAAAIADETERALIAEVLDRNPDIAAIAARATAVALRAPQVEALPDPMVGVTAFVKPPETRVGPQQASLSVAQRFPWFGTLGLRERAALFEAAEAAADLEAVRLKVLTESRRLYYELGFVDALAEVVRADRATLSHYSELAKTRYESGVGLQQAVIKLQTEITNADARLLEIGDRRASLVAALNAMRDLPQSTPLPPVAIPVLAEVRFDPAAVREQALASRPLIVLADARIARSQTMTGLSEKRYKPDLVAGLFYTWVGDRDDPAGRLNPPSDNGEDIFGISAGISIPLWGKKLSSGLEEALSMEQSASEARRAAVASIDRTLGELTARLEYTWDQLRLFEDVVVIQAEQSLLSAEAGYSAGSQDALDLLDAERVLLDVRTAIERSQADYAKTIAELEGAVGAPLVPAAPIKE